MKIHISVTAHASKAFDLFIQQFASVTKLGCGEYIVSGSKSEIERLLSSVPVGTLVS